MAIGQATLTWREQLQTRTEVLPRVGNKAWFPRGETG